MCLCSISSLAYLVDLVLELCIHWLDLIEDRTKIHEPAHNRMTNKQFPFRLEEEYKREVAVVALEKLVLELDV